MENLKIEIEKIAENTLEHYLNSITRKRYVEDVEEIIQACQNSEPTKPDFLLIKSLASVYSPNTRGVSTAEEIKLIKDRLELPRRTILSLRNLRNTVVMMSTFFGDNASDKISAITYIIDTELFNKGAEV